MGKEKIIKERIDVLIFERGLAESREKAKTLTMMGHVFVNGEREDKPGTKINILSTIEVKGNPNPYVSRGGLKLEKAIEAYDLELSDLVCMDIGASTGGFTDCMLQNGAKKVYAVDVGYGQLAWKLRQNSQVIVMEKTNIRYVTKDQVKDPLDFFSIDVSFISLRLVIPAIIPLLNHKARGICLIKPQFEAGREKVGKKGVVRDPATHIEVIERICSFVMSHNFKIHGLEYSPIKGPEGNIEYLVFIEYLTSEEVDSNALIDAQVSKEDIKQYNNPPKGMINANNLLEKVKIVVENAHHTL